MNISSMFDGMSCGQIAAERAGLVVDQYFASEIDKYAIQVTQKNYPNTIQLGDATTYADWNLPKIDLAIAGSPCQDLSRLKSKGAKGLAGDKSKLFYAFYENLQIIQPEYFLLENVVMNDRDSEEISRLLGVSPVLIDSGDFSAQNRERLYWTNIDFDQVDFTSDLVLRDIMEPLADIHEKDFIKHPFDKVSGYDHKVYGNLQKYSDTGKLQYYDIIGRVFSPGFKCGTLTAVAGGRQEKKVMTEKGPRRLTPLEYERLQTVPEGYTSGVSNSQRYKMLGNGWTVDVIAHILRGIKK